MAVLHDGAKIYQGLGRDHIIGITSSPNENEIIVTKLRSVETFKIGDTKPLSSWSTKLPLPFSCPVIFDKASNEFVAVCNQNSLAKWTYETQDLSKKHFKEVESDMQSLLTSELLDEPVVVFCDGYVEGLHSVSESRKKMRGRKLLENEEIMDQCVTKKGQMINVVLLTGRAADHQLLIVPIPCQDGGTARRCQLRKPMGESTVCDSCFFQDGELSKLFILWSDGSIWSYSLDAVMRMEDRSAGLDGQRILKLSSDNNLSKVCIKAIHADYIAISGVAGLDGQASESLSVWSIPYGTLQSHVKLPTSDKPADTGRASRCLVCLKDHILCATSTSLTCHSCHCESATLAQALGKLSVNPKEEGGEDRNLIIKWSTDELEVQVSSLDILKTKEGVLKVIQGPNKRKIPNAFQKDIQFLQTHSPSVLLDVLKLVAEDASSRGKKRRLPGEMIEFIIKTSNLAGSACPEFLSAVLEDANPSLILTCLEHMQDIPEPFVVKCLEFFLSLEESKISDVVQNGTSTHPGISKVCPLGQSQTQCINRVIGCPFNTVFLLSSMKKVKFDSILLFLKYLAFLISKEGQWSDGILPDETLIDWISVTLDAHFTQLILTPEAKDILVSLQSYINKHVEFYSEVKEVHRFLQAMNKATRTIPKEVKTKEEGHYSVEFLKL